MRFLIRLTFRAIDRLEYGLSTLLWRYSRHYRRSKMRRALRIMTRAI